MIRRFLVATALAAALCPLGSVVAQTAARQAPTRDSISMGGRTIAEGTTVAGPIVVAGGDLTVNGKIEGSAVAIAGDVIIGNSGNVTGDAIAAFGDVRNSGTVVGATRSLTGTFGASLRALFNVGEATTPQPSRSPLELALGWLTVMMLIGLGILIFASPYLEGVVDVLEQSFWRSFITGIIGELGILPAVLVVVVGLAITVIGVLLIPFAVVALVLVIAGLLALGFVAAARMTGAGIAGRGRAVSEKGSALRGIIIGLAIYMGLWVAAAALGNIAVAGTALRVLAFLLTFVAATAGFGAALLSRGGTRRDAMVAAPAPAADIGWQTPTPVAGVAAARRPRPTADAGRSR